MKKFYLLAFSIILFLITPIITSFGQCPNLCFTASNTNVCKGTAVVFTITSTNPNAYRYEWNFNDGTPTYTTTVPTTTVSHTYTSTSNFSVNANVYDIGGAYLGYTYGNSGNISVNGLSSINTPDSVCPGDVANMCVNSYSGGGFPVLWKFGDGYTYNSNENCTNHTYTANTTYTITAIATTQCPIDSLKKAIKVTPNAKPSGNWWTYGNGPFCPNQQIDFMTDPAASYTWTFGDGGTSSQQSPAHSYTATGTYSVTIEKTNVCGNTNAYTNTVTIASNVTFPNQSWFKLYENGSPACPNSQIGFDAPNGYSSYEWNFGDGTPIVTTSTQYTQHQYGSALNTFTVSVKITNACNNDTTLYTTVQIVANAPFPNQSWFDLNTNSPSCPNSEVNFDAPGGFSLYEWNFGDGSPLVSTSDNYEEHLYGSALITYTISVKITNGCNNDTTLYTTLQIMNNIGFPASNFNFYTNNPNCVSNPVQMGAPGGYNNYVWAFGDGDSTITSRDWTEHTYSLTGTYNVSVTITNSCGNDTTIGGSIVVDNTGSYNNNNLNIDVNPNNGQSCPNDIISFSMHSGSASSYEWNFDDGTIVIITGQDIQHSYTATGTYNVSCKLTNGCGLSTTVYTAVSITNSAPVNPGLYMVSIQNPSCIGDGIYMIPQNGQSSYTYFWSYDDGGKDTTFGAGAIHSFSTNGNHSVTVTAKNGCGLTKLINFVDTVKANAFPSLTMPGGDPIWGVPGAEGGGTAIVGCKGDAIVFYFMGEAANNLWDFGDSISGMATEHMVVAGGDGGVYPVTIIKHAYAANGTYTVSLTLTNSCGNSVSKSMTIVVGGNLAVNGEMSTSPPPFSTCAAVDFIGFGGESFDWDFGDGTNLNTTSPTVSHTYATQGVYAVSVVMTNGCGNTATYSSVVNVTGAGGPAVTLNSSSAPTCVGGTNGTASVNVTDGFPPYTYVWTANGQTTTAATGLSEGLYYVNVTDDIGCSSSFAVSINNPAPISLASSSTQAGCGLTNGTASVTVASGGTAPFTYSWTNGSTTANATGLGYGMYMVQASDVNGCTSSMGVSISEANASSVALTSITNASCNTGSNGSINITVTGGTPPYVYAWSNGSTVQDPTGLAAGTYSVLVTDGGSCVATFNATVTQPNAVVVSTSVMNAPTCGNFDGSTSASAAGGTGAYTYLWDSNALNQTTQIASGLPAGSYSVVITDANGCSGTAVASLSNSNAPVISAVVSDVSCFGGSNGSVNLTVVGGTPGYIYTWNVGPPQTNNQDVSGLVAGTYFVSVKDAKQCFSYQLYTITQPAVLTATATNTGATCGNNDGIATASVSGGNAGFTYAWSGGQSTQTATGLALGNYTVTVTDNKGCSVVSTTSLITAVNPIEICGITVDNTSTKNVIVWEKPVATNIDSFRIHRNIATVFTYVGAVAYQDSSYFVDNTTGVNPNTTSYQYKLKALDNCGNESVFGPLHQTIHLAVGVAAPPKTYNLIWTDYLGFPITQYRILVDSLNDGNWKVRDSVAYGSPKQWSDIYHYPNDTVGYMIEIEHPTGCMVSSKNPDPMGANLNYSKSNINKIADSTGTPHVANIKNELAVSLYPNPSSGLFTVDIKELLKGPVSVKVFNMLGEELRGILSDQSKNKIIVDMNKRPAGVYYVHISNAGKMSTKKIIID